MHNARLLFLRWKIATTELRKLQACHVCTCTVYCEYRILEPALQAGYDTARVIISSEHVWDELFVIECSWRVLVGQPDHSLQLVVREILAELLEDFIQLWTVNYSAAVFVEVEEQASQSRFPTRNNNDIVYVYFIHVQHSHCRRGATRCMCWGAPGPMTRSPSNFVQLKFISCCLAALPGTLLRS